MANPSLMDMLHRGYFPKELPPTFTTKLFGTLASTNGTPFQTAIASCKGASLTHHYFARPGMLRRTFSIPNPIFQYQLAQTLATRWNDIENFINNSDLSISKPVTGGMDERAIRPRTRRSELLDERLKYR